MVSITFTIWIRDVSCRRNSCVINAELACTFIQSKAIFRHVISVGEYVKLSGRSCSVHKHFFHAELRQSPSVRGRVESYIRRPYEGKYCNIIAVADRIAYEGVEVLVTGSEVERPYTSRFFNWIYRWFIFIKSDVCNFGMMEKSFAHFSFAKNYKMKYPFSAHSHLPSSYEKTWALLSYSLVSFDFRMIKMNLLVDFPLFTSNIYCFCPAEKRR